MGMKPINPKIEYLEEFGKKELEDHYESEIYSYYYDFQSPRLETVIISFTPAHFNLRYYPNPRYHPTPRLIHSRANFEADPKIDPEKQYIESGPSRSLR